MMIEPVFSEDLDGKNRGIEPKKKFKKKRSIRVSRVPSLRSSSSRRFKSRLDWPTASDLPTFSPNKGCSQGGSECDDGSSEVSSSSGSTDCILLPSEVVMSDDGAIAQSLYSAEVSGASPNHSKTSGFCEESKASSLKASSLRNAKVLIKKASFKAKKISKKAAPVTEDSNVERATCSSTIKDARFPDQVELQPGERESDRISFAKVCRYHHCSLNGHCHGPSPPTKKFSFRRRQPTKPQMTAKPNSASRNRTKTSAKGKEKNRESKEGKTNFEGPEASTNQEESKANLKSHKISNESRQEKESVQRPQFNTGKQISMWRLIHKQLISSLVEEDATSGINPVQGAEKGKHWEDAPEYITKRTDDSSPSYLDTGINNIEQGDQEIEIRKLFAVKLVREAIEKILLPEVQDQSSETQSITSESIEDQGLPENNHQEDPAEVNYNCSTNNNRNHDNDISNEQEKSNSETKEVKSDKKAPSNWSNLKKWIIIQRFVKALEKVGNFKYGKPRQLQSESGPEAEKVSLRHQTVEERKRSEEWMLDYAIRQVVSQLAPTQKKKVALLVKAFETVVPPPEEHTTKVPSHRTKGNRQKPVFVAINVEASESKMEDIKPQAKGNATLKPDDDAHMSTSIADVARSPKTPTEVNVPLTEESHQVISAQKTENLVETEHYPDFDDVTNESSYSIQSIVTEDIHTEQREITLKNFNVEDGENGMKSEPEQVDPTERLVACNYQEIREVSIDSTLVQRVSDENDKSTEQKLELAVNHDFLPTKTESQFEVNETGQSQMDKENYIRMWHMVYQHVASNVASKVGNRLLGEDEAGDSKRSSDEENSEPEVIPKEGIHDEITGKSPQRSDFTKSDAVKLIQEAVDEILLPEIPDDASDTQSVTSETVSDLGETEQDKNGKENISNTNGLSQVDIKEFKRSESGTESVHSKLKRWRKLKTLILLKSSLKAMEKARKLKFVQPKNLPTPPDAEPEKIDLRRQMVNERKKAEQWMLDYAVQNIVKELTPARKRRVSMLVEAFEAVVPLPDI